MGSFDVPMRLDTSGMKIIPQMSMLCPRPTGAELSPDLTGPVSAFTDHQTSLVIKAWVSALGYVVNAHP